MQPDVWKKIKAEIAIWRAGATPGLVLIGVIILGRLIGLLQPLEWLFLDTFLRLRPSETVDERIVIVGINEADIRSVKDYPIPDKEIAGLITKLQTYKPRAIGLDIFRDLPVKQGNDELVNTFKESQNFIGIEKVFPPEVAAPPTLPPEQVGFVDNILDTDGKLRRILLATPTRHGYKYSLSLRLAQTYLSAQGISLENGIRDTEAMRFHSTELPRFRPNSGGYVQADAGGMQILLNFRSGRERFRTLSLNDIKTGNFEPSWISSRIVIIGMTAASVKDLLNTSAISSDNPGLVYGVETHAHAVSQILSAVLDNRPLLHVWADSWEYLWILGWGVLGIALSRVTQSPLKNILAVAIASTDLVVLSYILVTSGWWIPVVPALIVLSINGVVLTAFYQYDQTLRSRIQERQFIINSTFDTIHNGPIQTLARLLRRVEDEDLPREQLQADLKQLNHELRAIHQSMQKEILTQSYSLCLSSELELNLHTPIHELLYTVYNNTLERDLPCFKTLRLRIPKFDAVDDRYLSTEQKRGLCRFLEEALCNVGKHAQGVTRLSVTCTENEGWYTVQVIDNGKGQSSCTEGRGTQQARELARQLGGKFERRTQSLAQASSLSPQGTLCEITWPVKKSRFWQRIGFNF